MGALYFLVSTTEQNLIINGKEHLFCTTDWLHVSFFCYLLLNIEKRRKFWTPWQIGAWLILVITNPPGQDINQAVN